MAQPTGDEPRSEMTIYQEALLGFMRELCKEKRTKPNECAREAQDFTRAYIDAIRGEIYEPDEDT